MNKINRPCPTCEGEGMINRDSINETHHIKITKVWCEEAQEWLTLKSEICPECGGRGYIDVTEQATRRPHDYEQKTW